MNKSYYNKQEKQLKQVYYINLIACLPTFRYRQLYLLSDSWHFKSFLDTLSDAGTVERLPA